MARSRSTVPEEHRGRVAVVWGGASGMRSAVTQRLRELGARVMVMDADPPYGLSGEVGTGSLGVVPVNPSAEREVAGAFEEIGRRHGRVDYLVCCPPELSPRPFLEIEVEVWRRTAILHLAGVFLLCREALRSMQRRGWGRIVLVSSLLARLGHPAAAGFVAAAGGVLGFARSLALEVAAQGIRVNTLSPLVGEDLPGGLGAAAPLGRGARTEDVVEGILFLLGDEASYLIGQDLRVTGGVGLW